MRETMKTILLKDLPERVQDNIQTDITPYSTCLIGIRRRFNKAESQLLGTGTFIRMKDYHCILTACHVVEYLKKYEALGLGLSEDEHNYYIKNEHLRFELIAKSVEESSGPDLSIIILPQAELGAIKARKSFYSLDRHVEGERIRQIDINTDLLCACGFIEEWTDVVPSSQDRKIVKSFKALTLFTGARKLL